MSYTLELSDEEATVLGDMLDFWSEGFDEAMEMTIGDRSIDNVDDLLNATHGLKVDREAVASLQAKLVTAKSGD